MLSERRRMPRRWGRWLIRMRPTRANRKWGLHHRRRHQIRQLVLGHIKGRTATEVVLAWERASIRKKDMHLVERLLTSCFEWRDFRFLPEDDAYAVTELSANSLAVSFAELTLINENRQSGTNLNLFQLIRVQV